MKRKTHCKFCTHCFSVNKDDAVVCKNEAVRNKSGLFFNTNAHITQPKFCTQFVDWRKHNEKH